MKIRNWLYLYGTTFLWGGIAGLIIRFILAFTDESIGNWGMGDWLFAVLGGIWSGFMFSALSTLGFFIFLLLNQLGLGLFRKKWLWSAVMIVLMVEVYISYLFFGIQIQNIYTTVILPFALLIWATLVAYRKMKETNSNAFVPTLFFMFSLTILELFPALHENNFKSVLVMGIPLLIANTWQILTLHKVQNKTS